MKSLILFLSFIVFCLSPAHAGYYYLDENCSMKSSYPRELTNPHTTQEIVSCYERISSESIQGCDFKNLGLFLNSSLPSILWSGSEWYLKDWGVSHGQVDDLIRPARMKSAFDLVENIQSCFNFENLSGIDYSETELLVRTMKRLENYLPEFSDANQSFPGIAFSSQCVAGCNGKDREFKESLLYRNIELRYNESTMEASIKQIQK